MIFTINFHHKWNNSAIIVTLYGDNCSEYVFGPCVHVLQHVAATRSQAHQPLNFSFPQREFGKSTVVKRSFQAQWFQKWPSGHAHGYITMLIVTMQAFCFSCVRAYRNNHLPSTSSLEKSFKSTGFNCWKEV